MEEVHVVCSVRVRVRVRVRVGLEKEVHEMGASVSVSSGSVKNLTLYPSPVARP